MKAKELIAILNTVDPETEVKYNGRNAMINADHEITSGMVEFSLDHVSFQNDKEIHFCESLA
jgi:hypothetical protein